ncbi:hypothetical protein EBU94_05535 [bacterium]|nr:hypothetical protein [bacterium]
MKNTNEYLFILLDGLNLLPHKKLDAKCLLATQSRLFMTILGSGKWRQTNQLNLKEMLNQRNTKRCVLFLFWMNWMKMKMTANMFVNMNTNTNDNKHLDILTTIDKHKHKDKDPDNKENLNISKNTENLETTENSENPEKPEEKTIITEHQLQDLNTKTMMILIEKTKQNPESWTLSILL